MAALHIAKKQSVFLVLTWQYRFKQNLKKYYNVTHKRVVKSPVSGIGGGR